LNDNRSAILIVLAFSLSTHSLPAQSDSGTVVISGVVVDPMRKPVEGAEVLLVGSSRSVLTSSVGQFKILAPATGENLIRIRRPGFSAQLLRIAGEWHGQILLEPGVYQLPDIEVISRYAKPAKYAGTAKYDEYFRRRRLGIGEFIDAEEIGRHFPVIVADVLRGRAGIRVTGGNPGEDPFIAFSRCDEKPPRINVYVDGRKLIPIGGTPTGPSGQFIGGGQQAVPIIGEMLSRINVGEVELIEIFRGPSELPAEFNDGNCGAISVWTKQGAQ
jgi:hypothetical protein